MNRTKKLLVPVLATLLAGSTLAGAQTTSRTRTPTPRTNTQTQQPRQQRGDRSARASLTVKFYAGDPLKGGTLLSTATIQRDAARPANLFANAPKGATYVSIETPSGTRVMTLKDAQANAFDGRGPDGRDAGNDRNASGDRSAPNGRDARNGQGDASNDRNAPSADPRRPGDAQDGRGSLRDRMGAPDDGGLRLPGLQGASRVTFYASDPLAGGKAQTSISLNGALTAAQQQAVSQAASNAKFAVIERGGQTLVVDLAAQPGSR
ncbi:hypothetical protein [Deinococcus yavapaiensis]|uniref:Uncharacterized protein n=1 Tax=Deinococcus yavapaiensis KR-236 TaxID=694435 RepID=A0A318S4X9_9DEIO|nr:hypothetical protein [Deinococcus yavapaiensis]PYE52753.1 hypothetical protein DES52_11274 [Deinococcus yavapaiensis KR-236]